MSAYAAIEVSDSNAYTFPAVRDGDVVIRMTGSNAGFHAGYTTPTPQSLLSITREQVLFGGLNSNITFSNSQIMVPAIGQVSFTNSTNNSNLMTFCNSQVAIGTNLLINSSPAFKGIRLDQRTGVGTTNLTAPTQFGAAGCNIFLPAASNIVIGTSNASAIVDIENTSLSLTPLLTSGVITTATGTSTVALSNIVDASSNWPSPLSNAGAPIVSSNIPNPLVTLNASIDMSNVHFTFSNNGQSTNITGSNIFSTDFAIESWVYYNSTPRFTSPITITDFIGNRTNTNPTPGWTFGVNSNMQLCFYSFTASGSTSLHTQCNVVPLRTWTHIAVTYSNVPKTMSFYINGIAQSNLLQTGFAAAAWGIANSAATSASNGGTSGIVPYTTFSNIMVGNVVGGSNQPWIIHDLRFVTGSNAPPLASNVSLPAATITNTQLLLRAAPIRTQSNVPLTIARNGFVGIGKSNPQAQLDVNGDLSVTGMLNPFNFVGIIVPFGGSNAPLGWLICNGQSVSRTTYSALFQVIGTIHGSVDSSSFNVPDLRNRFLVGAGLAYSVASIGGSSNQTLTSSNLPPHTHSGITASNGDHQHSTTAADNGGTNDGTTAQSGGGATSSGYATGFNGNHAHTFTTDSGPGTSTPFSIMPPYYAISYIIKF
ncbi:hypothetical protein EBT25_11815 [bacterium]|nr:hypothetical protein [bacterium]